MEASVWTIWIFCFLCLGSLPQACGQTAASSRAVYRKIYQDMRYLAACFRRFNGTHTIGCSTDASGVVGAVYYIGEPEDLSWLLEQGSTNPVSYVAVLKSTMVSGHAVRSLKESGLVVGVLILTPSNGSLDEESPSFFSPDYSCPNQDSDLDGSCSPGWNTNGSAVFFEDFTDFPITVITNATESDAILECYNTHNRANLGNLVASRQCAAEVRSYMYGAKDSETCYRRTNHHNSLDTTQYCSPIGAQNVHMSVKAMRGAAPGLENDTMCWQPEKDEVVVLATRMDSFSMFENLVPGGNGAISGIVTLLAVANALKDQVEELQKADKDLWFMFFEGEAFDYIGSNRMAYDMQGGKFPFNCSKDGMGTLTAENIALFLEISQVGLGEDSTYISHTLTQASSQQALEILQNEATSAGLNVLQSARGGQLPPASVQSFLKMKNNLTHLVLSDHDESYKNRFYNSLWDTGRHMGNVYPEDIAKNASAMYDHVTPLATRLASLATTVANSVHRLVGGSNSYVMEANETYVANLLYCFLESASCELFREAAGTDFVNLGAQTIPFQTYVNVFNAQRPHSLSYFVKNLLAYNLGTVLTNVTSDQCKSPWRIWMNGARNPDTNSTDPRVNICVESSASYHDAQSPIFSADAPEPYQDYDWSSGKYPTWTESIWETGSFSVRIFLLPKRSLEIGTLVFGIGGFLACMVGSWYLRRRWGSHLGAI